MKKAKTILLVDDDKELCELLGQFLQQHQYQVLCAYDGASAIKMIKEKQIDLVLLDLMLACEDGLEICKLIRQDSKVPVIMLTAMKGDSEKILGLEYGADDYITKPFNNRELLARIRAVLRRVYPEK
jgi:DNA-binding response OmpR family regulator